MKLCYLLMQEKQTWNDIKNQLHVSEFEADKVSNSLNQGKMFGDIKNGRL